MPACPATPMAPSARTSRVGGVAGAWALQVLESTLTFSVWLVLLQMGTALSWNWFSGLLPLALWWTWLLLAPLGGRGLRSGVAPWMALAIGLGVGLAQGAGPGPLGWAALVLVAIAWAQWHLSARPLQVGREGPTRRGAGPRLSAQAVAWLLVAWVAADPATWPSRWIALPVLCGVWAAGCWAWQRRPASLTLRPEPGAAQPPAHGLADPAMALAMGSLLLMLQWCASAGWTFAQATVAHGWAMVLGQGLAWACWPRSSSTRHRTGHWLAGGVGPALVLVGAGMFWLGGVWQAMLLGMVWMALGGALRSQWPGARHSAALGLGLVLPALLWVGHASPVRGPQAMAEALLVVAGAAALGSWMHLLRNRSGA